MKVPADEQAPCGNRIRKSISVYGENVAVRPAFNALNAERSKLTSEGPIVIASNRDQFGASSQFAQNRLNPFAFRRAGSWSVNQISNEDNALRRQLGLHGHEFLAGEFVG
jgi:hypothetical protein